MRPPPSGKNHLREDDFLCPTADAVHGSDPCKLVTGFQFLGDALRILHLRDDTRQPVIGLLVQVSKICPEFSRQKQFIVLAGAVFLQKRLVHPPPPPDGAFFLRQFQVGDVVVSNQRIMKAIVFIVNMFFEFFHVVDLLILV